MKKHLIKKNQSNINQNHKYRLNLRVNQDWKAASLRWINN